jgi:hypothetical protein
LSQYSISPFKRGNIFISWCVIQALGDRLHSVLKKVIAGHGRGLFHSLLKKRGIYMKRIAIVLMVMLGLITSVSAHSESAELGISITTEDFVPLVWLCDSRAMTDDNLQWGRACGPGDCLTERINNYAFEGEQISWTVLVMDKNGIEKVTDVFVTVQDGEVAAIEANCQLTNSEEVIPPECNARILEEDLTGTTFDPDTQAFYECTFTVEPPISMSGEFWVDIKVTDLDELSGTIDENEYWWFNPVLELRVDGDITFTDVRPDTSAYSPTVVVENYADEGSGVLMDMFISGTDFYDSGSSGAMCPTTNQLELKNFRYYAVNGAYSTAMDQEDDNGAFGTDILDPVTVRDVDDEGYVNIQYGMGWSRSMYNEAEIIQASPINGGALGYAANVLAPGAEMAITFRLDLPSPCNGDFDSGSIYFFGEAI